MCNSMNIYFHIHAYYSTHMHAHSMHILPQPYTEDGQFYKHAANVDFHIEYGMVDRPNPSDVRSTVHDKMLRCHCRLSPLFSTLEML